MGSDATVILERWARGEAGASDELIGVVYAELRALAERKMRREPAEATLQPTSLVHEAFMRLVDASRIDFKGRAHFLAVAANVMRRILIEHARARRRQKRGGGWERITLSEDVAIAPGGRELEVLALDEALERLAALNPREARVVELRVFAGLTVDETAAALGVSARTVDEDWTMAKAWLRRELSRGES